MFDTILNEMDISQVTAIAVIQGDRTGCPQETEKWAEWAALASVAHSAHFSVSCGHPVRSPCSRLVTIS